MPGNYCVKTLLIAWLVAICFIAKSQTPSISFDHLMVENGLPENYAIDIVQDFKGYMWCGTQKGVVRYDGYQVKVYTQPLTGNNTSNINAITTVFIDSKGIVWAGTAGNNILRYNENTDSFNVLKVDKSYTGTAISISYMREDQAHHLWIKSFNYVDNNDVVERLDTETGKRTRIKVKSREKGAIPAEIPIEIFSDHNRRIWIGTENGIYYYDEKSNEFHGFLSGTEDSTVQLLNNIYEPPSEPGILYMSLATKRNGHFQPFGLMRFDIANKKETTYTNNTGDLSSLPSDTVQSIFEDHTKHLWLGSPHGLMLFDRNTNAFKSFIPENKSGDGSSVSVEVIKQDQAGKLWMVGENDKAQGLTMFDWHSKKFSRYHTDNNKSDALASDYIEQLLSDRAGNIWLGFRNFGIQRINLARSRFDNVKNDVENQLAYNGGMTNSFAQTSDGIYWLGTSKGLVRHEKDKDYSFIALSSKPSEKNVVVNKVTTDHDDALWFKLRGKGLSRYNPKTGSLKSYPSKEHDTTSVSSDAITCLFVDHLGILWIGTDGTGLSRYNKATDNFTRYPFIHNFKTKYNGTALDDETVSAIYEDKSGRLWVSTNLGGLNLLDQARGTFTNYFDESAGIANVIDIDDADSGRLWLGSYLFGVSLFDQAKGTTIRNFNEKKGLLCDVVTGLKTDAEGMLWITSQRGLSRLDPKTNQIRNFTSQHGVPTNSLVYAPFKNQEGEIFLGYKLGYFSFLTEEMKPNPVPPLINLETISFTDKKYPDKRDTLIIGNEHQVELAYNQNKLEFYFTGIQYENPFQNTYQYKLAGYDPEWISGGTSRTAIYTNLGAGTYTFFVRASNMDGVMNPTPASIIVIINLPWWLTWWAWLIYVILGVLLIGGLVALRSRQLKIENRHLEEKVANRTMRLEKSLEELQSTQAQLIQSEKMASLGELTAGIAHEIQNPLNFVNNFSEVNTELIEELENELKTGNTQSALAISKDIKENEEKINHHGKRADAIVKGMLQHSRNNNGVKESTSINALADEYLRLSYQGLRAKNKAFNATMKTSYDNGIEKIQVVPQDIGRVLLNLYNNAFYTVYEKKKQGSPDYVPTVFVTTQQISNDLGHPQVMISVRDNGNGIPDGLLDKIFQPFFTTKPTGQGTGLGLSLSYDIIKAHGGEIKVISKTNEGSDFRILLPAGEFA